MAQEIRSSIVSRVIGVARLDAQTFEEVEHDESATLPAMIIAALAGLSLGVSEFLMDPIGWTFGEFVSFSLFFAVVAIVALVLFTTITYIIGYKLFRATTTEGSWVELLRILGYAGVPLVVAGWLTFLPFVVFAATGWFLVTVVVAVRQAVDVSTGRALAIAAPGLVILAVIQYALLLLIYSPV